MTIYVLVTQDYTGDIDGEITDLEVFSVKPTFPLTEEQSLFEANLDGGDSLNAS